MVLKNIDGINGRPRNSADFAGEEAAQELAVMIEEILESECLYDPEIKDQG